MPHTALPPRAKEGGRGAAAGGSRLPL